MSQSIYNLAKYESVKEFLSDYLHETQKRSPGFSIGAWSQKLGLSNKATLSRILSGQRQAGPEVMDRLCRYFQFDAFQKNQFMLLLRLEQEQDPDLKQVLKAQLRKSISPEKLDMHCRMSLLWGEVDKSRVNDVLAPLELCATSNHTVHPALVALKFSETQIPGFKPYLEFNMGTWVKELQEPIKDFGMFFDHCVISDGEVQKEMRNWSIPYDLGDIQLKITDACTVGAELRSSLGHLKYSVDRSLVSAERRDDDNVMFGYNQVIGAKERVQIEIRSDGTHFPYERDQDVFEFDPTLPLGNFLNKVTFKPLYWTFHHSYSVKISKPVLRN